MTRDEWYKSKKWLILRLSNQLSFEIGQRVQQLYDLLNILEAEFGPGLTATDRFNLVERQLRVLGLEATNLTRVMGNLESMLGPKSFDDMKYSQPKLPQKTCFCCECSEEYPEDDDTVFCPKCREKEKNRGQPGR